MQKNGKQIIAAACTLLLGCGTELTTVGPDAAVEQRDAMLGQHDIAVNDSQVRADSRTDSNVETDSRAADSNIETDSRTPTSDASLLVDARTDACIPACGARNCGQDGCGGACGICSEGVCSIDGLCTTATTYTVTTVLRPTDSNGVVPQGYRQIFGRAIAISDDGRTVAVGEQHWDVYVFERRNSAFDFGTRLRNTRVSSIFGFSVALSGDGQTVAAGDRTNVATFSRAPTTMAWDAANYTRPPSGNRDFGTSVALSNDGQTLYVCDATGGATTSADGPGVVTMYTKQGATWNAGLRLAVPVGNYTGIGRGLALARNHLALAVSVAAGPGGVRGVLTYRRAQISSAWSDPTWLAAIDNDANFGSQLAISGDGETLAVGNVLNLTMTSSTGTVHMFMRNANSWTLMDNSALRNLAGAFGSSLALDGNGMVLVVGASTTAPHGAAAIFTRQASHWVRLQQYAPNAGINFGSRVAITPNGQTILASDTGSWVQEITPTVTILQR